MYTQGKRVELHLHIDGAARHSTLWEIAKEVKLPLPGSGSLEDFIDASVIKVPKNLNHFLSPYQFLTPIYRGNFELMERIAYEYCEDAHKNRIVYLEIRYSPLKCLGEELFQLTGFDGLCEVVKRITAGTRRGEEDFGIKVRTILVAYHGMSKLAKCGDVLKLCQKYYDQDVVGMDLCTTQPKEGFVDEAPVTEELVNTFREAYLTKVHRTIHAGEASGPSAVERAVYKLGAERVGHGYHVVQDENLYNKCVMDKVHFECCPYSSLLTGAVKEGGPQHPIIRFADDGANFSLNSDDPTLTGHYLEDDYKLVKSWGFENYQITEANINAAKASFLPEDEKSKLVKEIAHSYPQIID